MRRNHVASDRVGRSSQPRRAGGRARGRPPDPPAVPGGRGFSGLSGAQRQPPGAYPAAAGRAGAGNRGRQGRVRFAGHEFLHAHDVGRAHVLQQMPVLLRGSAAGARAREHARQGRRLAHEPDDGQLCDADQRVRPGAGAHHPAPRVAAVRFGARVGSRPARAASADAPGCEAARAAQAAERGRHRVPLSGGALPGPQRRPGAGGDHCAADGAGGGKIAGAGARGADQPSLRPDRPAQIHARRGAGGACAGRPLAEKAAGRKGHAVRVPVGRVLSSGRRAHPRG